MQCDAVWLSVVQRVAVCGNMLQCGAMQYSVLQCCAVCCNVYDSFLVGEYRALVQCGAVCYSVLQRVAVCCSVVQLIGLDSCGGI